VVELMGPAEGGIRTHVRELTARLRAQGAEVAVAGPAGALGDDPVDHVVDVPAGLDAVGLLTARRQLAGVPGDVVHAHGLKAGWVAVTSRPRRPVVLTAHNVVLGRSGSDRLLRVLERRLVARVDRLVSPSPAIDAQFASLLPPERRQVVVPVFPVPVPGADVAAVRADLGVGVDEPLAVAVARLHPQKDLLTLVRAWGLVARELPQARAVVVGEGPQRAELQAAIDAAGLTSSLRLVGARHPALAPIEAADVLLLTSKWEAIPLVVPEAALLGTPVVATDVGIVSQVISDGSTGFVAEVGEARGLAAGLRTVLGDRGAAAAMGARLREAASGRFDPDRLAAAVHDVYRGVLDG
jgi:glycosyltransferase involved in cell wall biosynthesis